MYVAIKFIYRNFTYVIARAKRVCLLITNRATCDRDATDGIKMALLFVCIIRIPYVCSLHFTRSLHFIPALQSAVCIPQSSFYTDWLRNKL